MRPLAARGQVEVVFYRIFIKFIAGEITGSRKQMRRNRRSQYQKQYTDYCTNPNGNIHTYYANSK